MGNCNSSSRIDLIDALAKIGDDVEAKHQILPSGASVWVYKGGKLLRTFLIDKGNKIDARDFTNWLTFAKGRGLI